MVIITTIMMTLMNIKIRMIMMMTATMMIKTKMMTISVMTMTKMMTLLISPGNLAHSIPPLPKHKIIFQRRKLVDVQHLKKRVYHETCSNHWNSKWWYIFINCRERILIIKDGHWPKKLFGLSKSRLTKAPKKMSNFVGGANSVKEVRCDLAASLSTSAHLNLNLIFLSSPSSSSFFHQIISLFDSIFPP